MVARTSQDVSSIVRKVQIAHHHIRMIRKMNHLPHHSDRHIVLMMLFQFRMDRTAISNCVADGIQHSEGMGTCQSNNVSMRKNRSNAIGKHDTHNFEELFAI